MRDGPNIAAIAAMVGDPARANMLTALLNGDAFTASELSLEAGVTKRRRHDLGATVVPVEPNLCHQYANLTIQATLLRGDVTVSAS